MRIQMAKQIGDRHLRQGDRPSEAINKDRIQKLLTGVTGDERPDISYQEFCPNQEPLFKQKPRTAGQVGSEGIPGHYA